MPISAFSPHILLLDIRHLNLEAAVMLVLRAGMSVLLHFKCLVREQACIVYTHKVNLSFFILEAIPFVQHMFK